MTERKLLEAGMVNRPTLPPLAPGFIYQPVKSGFVIIKIHGVE